MTYTQSFVLAALILAAIATFYLFWDRYQTRKEKEYYEQIKRDIEYFKTLQVVAQAIEVASKNRVDDADTCVVTDKETE